MCGRYTITQKANKIVQQFKLDPEDEEFHPLYNASPGMKLPVISSDNPKKLRFFKWGLTASPSIPPLINARADSLLDKKTFSSLVSSKRCAVIADSFYEWKKVGKNKTPYRFVLNNESLFSFAGLWNTYTDKGGQEVFEFTIITTTPNRLMEGIHNRMPVILLPEQEKLWLNTGLEFSHMNQILEPLPEAHLKRYAVSARVNNASNNSPDLLLPVAEQGELFT